MTVIAASSTPTDLANFRSICASVGRVAECCVPPVVSVPRKVCVGSILKCSISISGRAICSLQGPIIIVATPCRTLPEERSRKLLRSLDYYIIALSFSVSYYLTRTLMSEIYFYGHTYLRT
jgi:hypothetical protein